MVVCPICGKEITNMFDMDSVSCSHRKKKSSILVELCGSCFRMCEKAEKGEEEAVEKLKILRESMTDENAIIYVDGILNEDLEGNTADLDDEEEEYLSVLATTGDSFEDHEIIEYKEIVSGESLINTSFVLGLEDKVGIKGVMLTEKMQAVRKDAVDTMRKCCVEKGANAVIGVTLQYVNFAENIMGVMASGTAVVIK